MQAYRGMDIGTAKPTRAEQARTPHHLIDIADPAHDLTVAAFQSAGRRVLDDLAGRDAQAVVVGGSGLHFRALVDPLDFPPADPLVRAEVDSMADSEAREALLAADLDAAAFVDLENPRRVQRALEILRLTGATPSRRARSADARAVRTYQPEYPFTAVGVDPGDAIERRVRARIEAMLDRGLLDEVRALAGKLGRNASQAVGYKELLAALTGASSLEDAVEDVVGSTMRLVKRQRTFFRRDPRITWISWDDDPEIRYTRARAVLQEGASWNS